MKDYKEWRESEEAFDAIIQAIYDINRGGEERPLEEILKEAYQKEGEK